MCLSFTSCWCAKITQQKRLPGQRVTIRGTVLHGREVPCRNMKQLVTRHVQSRARGRELTRKRLHASHVLHSYTVQDPLHREWLCPQWAGSANKWVCLCTDRGLSRSPPSKVIVHCVKLTPAGAASCWKKESEKVSTWHTSVKLWVLGASFQVATQDEKGRNPRVL